MLTITKMKGPVNMLIKILLTKTEGLVNILIVNN